MATGHAESQRRKKRIDNSGPLFFFARLAVSRETPLIAILCFLIL